MSNIVLTATDVEKYVKTLSRVLQDTYRDMDAVIFSQEDTLSDEFQIACKILNTFYKQAQQYYSGKVSE